MSLTSTTSWCYDLIWYLTCIFQRPLFVNKAPQDGYHSQDHNRTSTSLEPSIPSIYSYEHNGKNKSGKSLQKSIGWLKRVPFSIQFTPHEIDWQDPTKDLVFVTACSSNHFKEIEDAIAGTQKYFPNKPIIFFDIGLTSDQANQVNTLQAIF